jgi:hypothetical protein
MPIDMNKLYIMNKLYKKILSLSLGYLTVTASYAAAPGWFPGDAFGGGFARPFVPPQAKQKKPRWAEEEDAHLRARVAQYGTKWKQIASGMPGRTGRQCLDRWRHYLAPGISCSEWTQEKDALLSQKVKELGPKWAKIAQFFPGRTDVNCKNRHSVLQRHQRPGRSHFPWTSEEDVRLLQKVAELDFKWDEIAQFFPGRTAASCRVRWCSGLQGRQNGIQGAQPPNPDQPPALPPPPITMPPTTTMPAQQQPPPLQPQDDFWDYFNPDNPYDYFDPDNPYGF